jgi:long-chain acyl-CoA synthetase
MIMEKIWYNSYLSDTKRQLEYPEIPVFQFLVDSAERYPNNTAVIFFGQKITFRELNELSDRFAHFLQNLGLKKGDRVAILTPNCPQNMICFFGVLKIGAVIVQHNPMYMERELEHQLNDSGCETLICWADIYPKIKNIRAATSLRHIVTFNMDGSEAPTSEGTVGLNDILAQYSSDYSHVPINPADLAVLQYTGGTTGVPKGCMLTHRNLVANVLQSFEVIGKNYRHGNDYIIGVLPLFHVYGLVCVMTISICAGITIILFPRFDPLAIIEAIHNYKVGIFAATPTMLIAINNHPDVGKYDLRCLHSCFCGSAPLPNKVKETFLALTGVEAVEGYGLSEASAVTHVNPMNGKIKIGSIGLPLPDIDIRIVDIATNEDCGIGQAGELWLKGPGVMLGYRNRPDETASVLEDGWLKTGDIAKMDEEGYAYIVSRKKDLIIGGGYNIYPMEVEEVLFTCPGVLEAVVVGMPDDYRGETVKAVVVRKKEATVTQEEIIAYCRSRLAAYKVPRIVEFRDQLPKTAVGKILRRVLRKA